MELLEAAVLQLASGFHLIEQVQDSLDSWTLLGICSSGSSASSSCGRGRLVRGILIFFL